MNIKLQNWFDDYNVWPYVVVIASLVLVSFMVLPLLDSMVLGVVFAYVGRPIKNRFGKRQMLGSLLATCCIVVPIFLVLTLGTLEIANQLIWFIDNNDELIGILSRFMKGLNIPPIFLDQLAGGLKGLLDIVMSLAGTVPLGLLNFLLSFMVCFFLLLDGTGLKNLLIRILPSKKFEMNQKYFAKIDQTLSGIFIGSIYTAIVGGIVAVIIFYLFNIPRPVALACLVVIAGLVPFLTWFVFIPISVYRYLEYGAFDAFMFFFIGSILVHLAEFFIRPYFVSAKSSLHPLLVMLTFIGGGLVAGMAGFFLAPALTGIIYAIYLVRLDEGTKSFGDSD